MPNRILKESICASETIDKLSPFDETVLYRLIVNCDDFGRIDARPKILIAKLYPLKEMKVKQMEDAIRALTAAELVIPYTVNGKPYLQMPTWDRHQTQRTMKGKYPAIDGKLDTSVADNVRMITDASRCNQVQASESRCRDESESESESESEYNPNPNTESESQHGADAPRVQVLTREDLDFETFWKAYPKKEGKKDARKAFVKIRDVPVGTMVAAIEAQKQTRKWQEDGGRYIPNPATWLNRGEWENETTIEITPAPQQSSNPFLAICQAIEEGDPL